MNKDAGLTDLQVELARLFFELKASHGYVVAGGAALVASDLIHRPTADLDLFASAPIQSVTSAKESFLKVLAGRGWMVTVIHDSPTFCRLVVINGEQEVLVDFAIDSPPDVPSTMTLLGPTLAPRELAGRKLLALFGRAEARDFADVYVLAQRFGKESLLALARAGDAGFDDEVLASMMTTLDRFTDDEIPIERREVEALRRFFAAWTKQLSRR